MLVPKNSHASTHNSQLLLLRARAIVPIRQPPIRDGAVLITRNRVAAVGPWRELAKAVCAKTIELGDLILLPGLVNAHCHLDYTHMAGQFLPPRVFTDWLKPITSAKAVWSQAEYARSWRHGAEMVTGIGTTTVADMEGVPELLAGIRRATP